MFEKTLWEHALIPPGDEDHLWELFHENSKMGRSYLVVSREQVLRRMQVVQESLTYEGYSIVDLPDAGLSQDFSLERAITTRTSDRDLIPCVLNLTQISTLLYSAYGVTRDNKGTVFPRPFRVVPSGGALYPLELFFHSAQIEGHSPGLYHYNASQHCLRRLETGDATQQISKALVQPELALGASLVVFITAVFERSVFKYGDRGYRYVLIESGHVAQNLNLVSKALGFGCVNIGGFYDREIDDFLGIDGVTHSTIYMMAIGKKSDSDHESADSS
jgi:SagB-type dehydrogenase family enzyme